MTLNKNSKMKPLIDSNIYVSNNIIILLLQLITLIIELIIKKLKSLKDLKLQNVLDMSFKTIKKTYKFYYLLN